MNNLSQEQFELIITYLQNAKLSTEAMNKYMMGFESNPDIANEFCSWIQTRSYDQTEPIMVEGYTANDIHNKVTYLDGLKVYSTMVKLREKPEYTKKEIESGTLGF